MNAAAIDTGELEETDETAPESETTAKLSDDARRAEGERLRELYPSIDTAIRAAWQLVQSFPAHERREVREDLRQALALKVLRGKLRPNGLKVAAQNALLSLLRDRAKARETEHEYSDGTAKRYRTGEIWEPTWYPPHPDAEQFAPLAMREARVMHVGAPKGAIRDVEAAVVEWIDSRRGTS